LPNDSILAISFVQRAPQPHYFCREVIAFKRGSELIGNPFAQSYFVILEAVARLAPNETKQPECVTSDAHRRYQSRASSEGGTKVRSK